MRKQEFPRWMGCVTAAFGVLLMILGIYRNELEILFTKAVNLCLECVGIG